jgi:hypothetical protein
MGKACLEAKIVSALLEAVAAQQRQEQQAVLGNMSSMGTSSPTGLWELH